ncbi:MAG: HEAT repeat domain-containing protein [Nitrospirae bacterium]|nr:MAG: HEAT repeat domain-containing protein [Nitrospirota bacterium]
MRTQKKWARVAASTLRSEKWGPTLTGALLWCAICLWVGSGLGAAQSHAQKAPAAQAESQASEMGHPIRTIYLTGAASTWLNLPQPPYNAMVTVKIKLKEAGFHVVMDPQLPHDAVMTVVYQERPSGQFRILEEATAVRVDVRLIREGQGVLYARTIVANPSPVPVGGLYWGTIHNLESDPYFFYLGELVKGWVDTRADAVTVLMAMLRRPYRAEGSFPEESHGEATLRKLARQHAIEELGRVNIPATRELLWELATRAIPEERRVAVTVLGNIGDSTFLPKLRTIAETDRNPAVQAAARAAIARIQGS